MSFHFCLVVFLWFLYLYQLLILFKYCFPDLDCSFMWLEELELSIRTVQDLWGHKEKCLLPDFYASRIADGLWLKDIKVKYKVLLEVWGCKQECLLVGLWTGRTSHWLWLWDGWDRIWDSFRILDRGMSPARLMCQQAYSWNADEKRL